MATRRWVSVVACVLLWTALERWGSDALSRGGVASAARHHRRRLVTVTRIQNNNQNNADDLLVGDDDNDEVDLEDADLLEIARDEQALFAKARLKMMPAGAEELTAPASATARGAADALAQDGVVRVNRCLPPAECAALADHVERALRADLALVQSHQLDPLTRFSSLLSSSNRWDYKLPLDDAVLGALKHMFSRSSAADGVLGPALDRVLSDRAELFELAAFYTAPGASRQVVHADTLFTKQPVLFTVAMALQDVTEEMGPTLFLPGTHTKEMHKKFDGARTKDTLLLTTPHKLSLLRAGDVSVYDSRTLHCGTENRSDRRRILLYTTWKNPRAAERDDDFWNVASIRPEYGGGKYTLKDFL